MSKSLQVVHKMKLFECLKVMVSVLEIEILFTKHENPPDANEVRAQDVDTTYVLAQRYKAAWTAVARPPSCECGRGGRGERERFIRTL